MLTRIRFEHQWRGEHCWYLKRQKIIFSTSNEDSQLRDAQGSAAFINMKANHDELLQHLSRPPLQEYLAHNPPPRP